MTHRVESSYYRRLASALLLACVAGCGSQPAKVPTAFVSFNAKDGTFACEGPEGWETKGGGQNGPVWAKFSSGGALIEIKASAAGSLMSDAMGGRTADIQAEVPQDAPVHHIHVNAEREAGEKFNGYTELPGNPIVIECQLGPARLSEFTARSSFGTPLHGYRATIIGHEKGVTVYCSCPESEWQALKPAFDHVFATLERGMRD